MYSFWARPDISDDRSDFALSLAEKKLNTDIGLSVTGISGPGGGTELKPVGLVYVSITYLNKIFTKKFKFSGNRNTHRLITASTALNMLRMILLNEIDFSNKKNN